jgi:hypothetical protein
MNKTKSHPKYIANTNFFKSIDSGDKAYLLGYLFTDGCLTKDNKIKLTLSNDDIDVLNYFNQKIYDGKRPILIQPPSVCRKKYIRKSLATLWICNTEIAEDLIKLGMHPKKTFTIKYPPIQDFHREFILGCFDGDGTFCFGRDKNNWPYRYAGIAGNRNFMTSIQNILVSHNIDMKMYNHSMSDIVQLNSSKKETIKKFYDFIYGGSHDFCLKRKQQKFIDYFNAAADHQLNAML